MKHECIKEFKTQKIDKCSGTGFNKCSGINPMILEIWFIDKDGTECFFDNFTNTEVNFCPFCGLKSQPERLSVLNSKEYAIV